MNILGISAFYHDSAAALVCDGDVRAAAQEERFTRIKHDPSFPAYAIAWCRDVAKREGGRIDRVVFYDKPFLKFERLIESYVATAPFGFASFRRAMPLWLREKLFQKRLLIRELSRILPDLDVAENLLFCEHHMSHAASAFYPSPFETSAILIADGVGEWATTSTGLGNGEVLELNRELHFPHSLGLLYSAFTYHLGFRVNSGEYKVMGLAPYGKPRFVDRIYDRMVSLRSDGSFRLDMRYFNFVTGLTMTNRAFSDLFGVPRRTPETDLEQVHMDLARSIQVVTEEIMLAIASNLRTQHDTPNLCMAGGVALNCVANSHLKQKAGFERIWVQPAAGDAGGALGAALLGWHLHEGQPRQPRPLDAMKGSLLGPQYSQASIEAALEKLGAVFEREEEDTLYDRTATAIADGKVVGWFQGPMEFGPRALGSRSVLADPRMPAMQKTLNLRIKFRESFRPFAPAVLSDAAAEWFDLDGDSPYMLFTAPVNEAKRIPPETQQHGLAMLDTPLSCIPAVTHVDCSSRVQTVDSSANPRFRKLLERFAQNTGCPVLVNTSFNVRGEPIVESPADAFRCFMNTDMDMLVIGDAILFKDRQPVQMNGS